MPTSVNVPFRSLWNRKLRYGVIGDERVGVAVAVVIGKRDAHTFPDVLADTHCSETSVNVPSPLLWNSMFGWPV